MLVIAHRGANREALENSWTAFEKAIDANSVRIELDVQLTADDELAVIHDHTLERTCGVSGEVHELTRAELEKIKLLNGEQIPFLDDVIREILPRCELNIEIKGNAAKDAILVADLVKKLGDPARVIVSSFHLPPLKHLALNNPDIPVACLWGDVFDWPHFAHYAPPIFMLEARAKIFHPWTNYLNEEVMDYARSRGWKVFPYASFNGEEQDREGLWSLMQTLGVDGLCTNYPREFSQWLAQVDEDARKLANSCR